MLLSSGIGTMNLMVRDSNSGKKEIDEIVDVCQRLKVTINDIVVNSPDGSPPPPISAVF